MDSHENRFVRMNISLDQGHVVKIVHIVLIYDKPEVVTEMRGQYRLGPSPNVAFRLHTILDQVLYGAYLEPVLLRYSDEIRKPGHCSVVVHHLTDYACRSQPCEPCQVYAAFGLTGPDQHSAISGFEGKHMTGRNQVCGSGPSIHSSEDRDRSVMGRNAGGCAFYRLD